MEFIDAVNSNRASCPGGKAPFTDLAFIKIDYQMTYSLDSDVGNCEKGEVPKKYKCLIKGEALKKLRELRKSPSFQTEVQKHINKHGLNDDMQTDFPEFVSELESKFAED